MPGSHLNGIISTNSHTPTGSAESYRLLFIDPLLLLPNRHSLIPPFLLQPIILFILQLQFILLSPLDICPASLCC